MRKLLFAAGVLTAIALMVPSAAVSQGKGKAKDKGVRQEATTEEDYGKLTSAKYKDGITGKITTLDTTAKAMTFKFEYQTQEPAPTKAGQENKATREFQYLQNRQQELAREYQHILTIRNAAERQRRLSTYQTHVAQWQQRYQQYLAANKGQLQTVTHAKDFELDIEVDVKVSRMNLPLEYDDKGNVKEYTKEELKKMRDKVLPGYTAKFEDVQPGQTVKLYLSKPKAAKKEKDKDAEKTEKIEGEGGAKKPGTKGDDKEGANNPPPRPTIRAIVIVAEPDPADQPKGKRKKKDQ